MPRSSSSASCSSLMCETRMCLLHLQQKPLERKRAALSEGEEKKAKKGKKSKDPSAPKRPPIAFFLFMEDFRKSLKEANLDNKSVAVVSKEGSENWKSMLEEEKKPYVERAVELKAEYEKAVEKHNQEDEEEEKEGSSKEDEEVEEAKEEEEIEVEIED